MADVFELLLVGPWEAVGIMFDPNRFEKSLNTWIKKATIVNGRLAVKAMRKKIKTSMPPQLHPLTLAMKSPKSKALVNSGQLWKSFGIELLSNTEVFAGPVKTAWNKTMSEAKGEFIDVAHLLHYGAKIKVTKKMRDLWNQGFANRYSRVKPLSPDTKYIIIKGRPWRDAVDNAGFRALAAQNWNIAIENAIYGTSKSFMSI